MAKDQHQIGKLFFAGSSVLYVIIGGIAFLLLAIIAFFVSFYKKVPQGTAMVRTGKGGTKVEPDKGMFVIPVLHMVELMDLSVKTVEISRMKEEGLICKDNIRADIKVVFFVRVNKDPEQIKNVAQSIGCKRASDPDTLRQLFEAKFSEALKTVGKRFDFVELYDNRNKFKNEIIDIIGTDLNGYVLDDAAIDYVEQTSMEFLKENNILDAEGIKKITELTAAQKVKANFIKREEEKKNIQDVIKERVMVEKKVVEEEEKIKDTREVATANRARQVAVIKVEEEGEATIIKQTKTAEAEKLAAEIQAKKVLIDAEAEKNAAAKEAEARKIKAEAKAAEEATIGMSEAQVIEAKAQAKEKEGMIEATITEKQAAAEAKGIAAKAEALHTQGMLEAEVLSEKGQAEAKVTAEKGSAQAKALEEKLLAEAKGVEQKALAMKKLDGVGKEHEEFKLRLDKEKAVELANIDIQRHIAEAQAKVLGEAFKNANIDIVGGEDTFINNIMNAVNRGKSVDRLLNSSQHLSDLKSALLGNGTTNGDAKGVLSNIQRLVSQSGLTSDDLRNLTMAALLLKLRAQVGEEDKGLVGQLIDSVKQLGIGSQKADALL